MQMNNEPVAVVDHRQQNGVTWLKIKKGKSVMPDHNTLLYTHPAKELDEQFEKGFKAGKEEGWKAHKFHHPAKELHLSLQKSKETGELLAVTYTDDEHRICLLYTSPSPRDGLLSRMPSSA